MDHACYKLIDFITFTKTIVSIWTHKINDCAVIYFQFRSKEISLETTLSLHVSHARHTIKLHVYTSVSP